MISRILLICLLISTLCTFGQGKTRLQLWTKLEVSAKNNANSNALYRLDFLKLKEILRSHFANSTTPKTPLVIDFPISSDKIAAFKISKKSNLSAVLSRKYPNIQSFSGQCISDKSSTIRFSLDSKFLHCVLTLGDKTTFFIDPLHPTQKLYRLSSKSNQYPAKNKFKCHVKFTFDHYKRPDAKFASKSSTNAVLRTYRLALAGTAAYSQFHLSQQNVPNTATDEIKKEAVLSAMNTSLTRVNQIFERDLGIHFNLVADNDKLIFLNTDSFTEGNLKKVTDENQVLCDQLIGTNNYDIGHVLGVGEVGGLASTPSVCDPNYKASAATFSELPIGDSFDVDYLCHEIGHQFNADHTQNNDDSRFAPSAVEPGSGSTIMGYAGISPPNVQNEADPFFHAKSMEVIQTYLDILGNSCGQSSTSSNIKPIADAGLNYTIPAGTPFVLKGSASDGESNGSLTFSWEQMDTEIAQMPPSALSDKGPVFRSLPATTSPNRYMPKLETVLTGQTASVWEVVPVVSRQMNFRLTVRDNNPNIGGVGTDDTLILTDENAGPFRVTSQNEGIPWNSGDIRTIEWDVANTNIPPVNASQVDILLSVDGGLSYPIVLKSKTANDGSEDIAVPENIDSDLARIMVRGSDHIFYNVNAVNFKISNVLGISDLQLNNFEFWPNPTQDYLYLAFDLNSANQLAVYIYDLTGNKVFEKNNIKSSTSRFSTRISTSGISQGVYFVQIRNGRKVHSTKMIKN